MLSKFVASITLVSSGALRTNIYDAIGMFEDAEGGRECPRTIAEVSEPLQMHFDRQRVELGLMDASELEDPNFDLSTGSTEKCTKRDVCLLMRQLDMDFYQRARAGTLTDMDFDSPPDLVWIKTGTCASAEKTRGKRFKPVLDSAKCMAAVRKSGLVGQSPEIASTSDRKLPAGCVIEVNNKKRGDASAYINNIGNSTESAGPKRKYKGKSTIATSDIGVQILCEHDRSLSEAAAVYYSPYKLKQSMALRPQMSTSCSFGMYAYLAKLKETKSSCAKLLTAQTSPRFYSAADALKQAAAAESFGNFKLASEIRKYVEDVRTKFVLIDTVANKWCPGVWNAAQEEPGGTCDVSRKMSWTEEGKAKAANQTAASKSRGATSGKRGRKGGRKGGRMGTVAGGPAKAANADRLRNIHSMLDKLDDATAELLAGAPVEKKVGVTHSDGRIHKMALSESFCSTIEDEVLADILADAPIAPPDFFQGALLDTANGDHPPLTSEETEKWVKGDSMTGGPRARTLDKQDAVLQGVVEESLSPSEVIARKAIDQLVKNEDMSESEVRDIMTQISDVPAGMQKQCGELHKTCKVVGLRGGNADAFSLGKFSDCNQWKAHQDLAGKGADSAEVECEAILNNIARKLGLDELRKRTAENAMNTDFRYR